MGSKIVRFLRKLDGPSRNLDKANFSPKKKGKQCAAFGCSNTCYGPNGLPTSFHVFKLMHGGMYFSKYLSFYTYLILCESWTRVAIVAKLLQIF